MNKYQSYKDSGVEWVGEIPSHWEVSKIRFIGKLFGGLSGKKGDDFNNDKNLNNKPYIPFTNIFNNTYISKDHFELVNINDGEVQNRVQKYDLFFLMSSEGYEDLGKCSILIEEVEELYLNSFCKGFRITDERVNPLFINYQLYGDIHRKIVSGEGRGFTRINLRQDKLKDTPIFLPSLYEQQQIVTYLDQKTQKIDDLIKHKKRKIELLKEKRTSLINHVVTKGLDPNVEMKDSGVEWIGEIPRHWEIIPLKFLGKFQNGISKGSEFFGKGLPFMNYGDVYKNEVTPKLVEGKVESDEIERDRYSVRKGDVFFTRTSETKDDIGVTSTCLKTIDNCVFSGFVIRFRFYEDTHFPEFSRYHFQSHWKKVLIESKMNIVTRSSLSQRVLGQVPVLIPPSKEQNQIVNYLNSHTNEIDDLISMEQKKIKLLKEYRQSIISEVVTGKRRVCKEDHSVELKNEMV